MSASAPQNGLGSAEAPEPDAGLRPSDAIPRASDFPDSRPIFEARVVADQPWVWEVWDIEHPAECNHFPVLRVDSKGASEDFHEEIARLCATALNKRWAVQANRNRRAELELRAGLARGEQ